MIVLEYAIPVSPLRTFSRATPFSSRALCFSSTSSSCLWITCQSHQTTQICLEQLEYMQVSKYFAVKCPQKEDKSDKTSLWKQLKLQKKVLCLIFINFIYLNTIALYSDSFSCINVWHTWALWSLFSWSLLVCWTAIFSFFFCEVPLCVFIANNEEKMWWKNFEEKNL